jgi:hypothetical protein
VARRIFQKKKRKLKLDILDQHWQALTDNDGIIGPDGNSIRVKSIVPNAPKGQFVAVIDSGYVLGYICCPTRLIDVA